MSMSELDVLLNDVGAAYCYLQSARAGESGMGITQYRALVAEAQDVLDAAKQAVLDWFPC